MSSTSQSPAMTEEQRTAELHGRTYNTLRPAYALPADSKEHSRLDMQHVSVKTIMQGLYPSPGLIQKALAPRKEGRPTCLDIGTGSGIW